MTHYPKDAVAIIGAAVNFPGASDLDAYRRLLREGRQAMQPVPRDLLSASIHAGMADRPEYVAMNSMLAGHDLFDAEFFGLTPREAMLLDPQQRHLLQCAWQAHEHAGIVPGDGDTRRTGVFTSVSHSAYLTHHLMPQVLDGRLDMVEVGLANDKDFAPARLAWKLDLRGPAIAVQTACSSSLVALHLACRSLAEGECDLALVAAATIILPAGLGYLRPGRGIVSADGRCRPFSQGADGTIFASGAAAVLLRPLADALAAGDAIMAVIRGSATNNDGAKRAGFTAPNPDGQSAVIAEAMAVADVTACQLGYIEAHGTATPLGDPIELTALSDAMRDGADGDRIPPGTIPLGAVKANLGHLDTASGLAGLLKTVIALEDESLPPTPHALDASPAFAGTPLRPLPMAQPWPRGTQPRIAGVSAFGMGGSNAHVILQEPPLPATKAPARAHELLILSARDQSGLDQRAQTLAAHLDGGADLADVAHVLRTGRKTFAARAFVVASSGPEAADALRQGQLVRGDSGDDTLPLVFVLPGQGSQYAALGRCLADTEPSFSAHRARLIQALCDHGGPDIDAPGLDDGAMRDTWLAQAALFANGAALGLTLRDWGVSPDAIIGHSVGEVAAALLSGALSEDHAARLLVARARAMRDAPGGAMALLQTDRDTAQRLIADAAQGASLTLAAINAPLQVVAAGDTASIDRLTNLARMHGIGITRLATSHAFHSPLMTDAAKAIDQAAQSLDFRAGTIPVISTLTGTALDAAGFGATGYWAQQMLGTVRFADALTQAGPALFVELGPPGGLASAVQTGQAISLLPSRDSREHGARTMLAAMGQIWLAGHDPDWHGFDGCWPGRRRPHLPGYPFRRDRHWPDAEPPATAAEQPERRGLPRHPRPAGLPVADPCKGFAETALAALFEELLLITPIGRADSFSDLGGGSILALQLAQRAAEQGLRLTVQDVFESPDLADLARRAVAPVPAPVPQAAPETRPDLESLNTIRAQLNGML